MHHKTASIGRNQLGQKVEIDWHGTISPIIYNVPFGTQISSRKSKIYKTFRKILNGVYSMPERIPPLFSLSFDFTCKYPR